MKRISATGAGHMGAGSPAPPGSEFPHTPPEKGAFRRRAALAATGLVGLALTGCHAPLAAGEIALPAAVNVPAGAFVAGSDRAERDAAYALDEKAYGHGVTRERQWYENELPRQAQVLPAYSISRNLITNAQYADFVSATGHRPPRVDEKTWASYGLIHPWSRTRRFAWIEGAPADGRGDHPVVLVSRGDAEAYAAWLSRATGHGWRLPTELEWEKAARGVDGRRFPWGEGFAPRLLNSHDAGPFDTLPVGSFPEGASPFGILDAAGQVFEWTSTTTAAGRAIVKGGSWDDKGCGVCRPAARHGRPPDLKHILIGFRLVRE
jgi:formylglycine-generating enzyme required for sulfatase activity